MFKSCSMKIIVAAVEHVGASRTTTSEQQPFIDRDDKQWISGRASKRANKWAMNKPTNKQTNKFAATVNISNWQLIWEKEFSHLYLIHFVLRL